MIAYPAFRYAGAIPGADTNAHVLFSTVSLLGQAICPETERHRLRVDLAGDQAGSFNLYKSRDRGVTWRLVSTTAASPSSAATATLDVIIEPYYDWKLEWANGGSAQSYFVVDMSLQHERFSVDSGAAPPPPVPTFNVLSGTDQVVSGAGNNVISQ